MQVYFVSKLKESSWTIGKVANHGIPTSLSLLSRGFPAHSLLTHCKIVVIFCSDVGSVRCISIKLLPNYLTEISVLKVPCQKLLQF